MPDNKMLIDATHPEETRVVVLRGGRVEEFDYESAARKLLRGNIYLAKVTRVEPALQAAFVEYGGNRHGFLAFNEIHPDYYQIPVADRIALIEEEAAAEAAEEAAADALAEQQETADLESEFEFDDTVDADEESLHGQEDLSEDSITDDLAPDSDAAEQDEVDAERDDPDAAIIENDESETQPPTTVAQETPNDETLSEPISADTDTFARPFVDKNDEQDRTTDTDDAPDSGAAEPKNDNNGDNIQTDEAAENHQNGENDRVEEVGTADALEEVPYRSRRMRRSYKIQEVIKRRQVLLVQVVKEERGNKGAALTTYLSLAGRYTVLMPNTARGGGISRKITNPPDRKRMKAIADGLDVPEGMGLIIRTAGASRTKQEIRRDFDYLLRLWESVRQLTFESSAPNLVYEEGNLIKRSIRDLYNKEVEEILVAGEHAHKEAKSFMRMLMPSHARNVNLYKDPEPLFTKFQIERQLNAMFSPHVPLKSGGYLVINQTEALVAIDVNSGRSTREFSIEETALHTNLEAAAEIARQLKLRDLAGLIVIDFIDMEERRNNRAVERRIKDVLRNDRARVQVGRISHFGLLEMSRQRMRTGVLEGSTSQCHHCQGTGIIRSTESVALAVLRALEDAVMSGTRSPLLAQTTSDVALYIFNHKRDFVNDMEARHGLPIVITDSDKMTGATFSVEKGPAPTQARSMRTSKNAVNMDWGFSDGSTEPAQANNRDASDDGPRKRRRRRRSRRGERVENGERRAPLDAGEFEDSPEMGRNGLGGDNADQDYYAQPANLEGDLGDPTNANGEDDDTTQSSPRRGRRRGRRGGRRNRERRTATAREFDESSAEPVDFQDQMIPGNGPQPNIGLPDSPIEDVINTTPKSDEFKPQENETQVATLARPEQPDSQTTEVAEQLDRQPSEPQLKRIIVTAESGDEPTQDHAMDITNVDDSQSQEQKPTRKGWWQRRSGNE